ncbi:hypothetical protein D3C83_293310 [compost metagenome]
MPVDAASAPPGTGAADMQTVAVLARGEMLGLALAAILIVVEGTSGESLGESGLESAAKRAGRAASASL